jgi:hypothetical protein
MIKGYSKSIKFTEDQLKGLGKYWRKVGYNRFYFSRKFIDLHCLYLESRDKENFIIKYSCNIKKLLIDLRNVKQKIQRVFYDTDSGELVNRHQGDTHLGFLDLFSDSINGGALRNLFREMESVESQPPRYKVNNEYNEYDSREEKNKFYSKQFYIDEDGKILEDQRNRGLSISKESIVKNCLP